MPPRAVQPILRRCLFARTHFTLHWPAYMSAREKYGDWSRNQLLRRIAQLEGRAASLGVDVPPAEPTDARAAGVASTNAESDTTVQPSICSPAKKQPRHYDVSAQPSRKIALRFCYDGGSYSGLAAQMGQMTPLPTVEETIWEALCTARLVDATKSMDDVDWSRCGRTDAGVSAAGQVVALWIRSRCVDERPLRYKTGEAAIPLTDTSDEELPYVATLNRLLPPTIRIQAWSPVRPTFSARFDCVYRHYKYFFTLGAPSTLVWQPESLSQFSGRLDLDRMRDAAARLVGEHDFRNMCKVDASKQITNFRRRIDGATIDPVCRGWSDRPIPAPDPHSTDEPMYVLNLRGSAFLYHQVRHIMAVLFMVGARLEDPSIVDELLNVHTGAAAADRLHVWQWLESMDSNHVQQPAIIDSADRAGALTESGSTMARVAAGSAAINAHDKNRILSLPMPPDDLPTIETKPAYEMAADRPLMLWECGFHPSHVQWRASTYAGPMSPIPQDDRLIDYSSSVRASSQLHALWTSEAIRTELMRHLVLATATGSGTSLPTCTSFEQARSPLVPQSTSEDSTASVPARAHLVPLGNGTIRPTTRYKRLAARPRDVSADVKNEKWREGKGRRRAERRQSHTPADS